MPVSAALAAMGTASEPVGSQFGYIGLLVLVGRGVGCSLLAGSRGRWGLWDGCSRRVAHANALRTKREEEGGGGQPDHAGGQRDAVVCCVG